MYKLYQVYNLLSKYNLPTYVKKATWEEITAADGNIPDHLFADDKFRLYPCHTAAATLISAAQFNEDKDKYNKERKEYIETRLKKHAQELGVLPDVEDVLEYKPEQNHAYALEHDGRRLFPIRNALEIKKLAEYLVKNYRDIPQEYREIAARNALKEADNKNYALGQARTILEKLACDGIVNKSKLLDILQATFKKTSPTTAASNPVHEAIGSLMAAVADIPATNQRLLREAVKIASDLVPAVMTLQQPLELDVVYTVSELKKEAEDVIRLSTGSYYKKADILTIPSHVLKERFDNYDTPIEINGVISHEMLFKAAQALDEDAAENFEETLHQYDVYPVVCEAKSYTIPV